MLTIPDSHLQIAENLSARQLEELLQSLQAIVSSGPMTADRYWNLMDKYPHSREAVNHYIILPVFKSVVDNDAINAIMANAWKYVEPVFYSKALAIAQERGFDYSSYCEVRAIFGRRLLADIDERAWNRLFSNFIIRNKSSDSDPKTRDKHWQAALSILQARAYKQQPISDIDAEQVFAHYVASRLDKPTAYWAILLSGVYESTTHKYTDRLKAQQLLVEAAADRRQPDADAAAWNIGIRHMAPTPGNAVDNQRALFWLTQVSSALDDINQIIIDLIEDNKELEPLKVHLLTIADRIKYDLSDPTDHRSHSGLFLARAHNNGLYGKQRDQKRAQAYYHAVSARAVEWHPAAANLNTARAISAQAAATRALLGIGMPRSLEAALDYANDLLSACQHDSIHSSDWRYAANRIKHLAHAMQARGDTDREINLVLTMVDKILAKSVTPESLKQSILDNKVAATELFEGCLWALNEYLQTELTGYPQYEGSIAVTQARLLGHTKTHKIPNAFKYNKLSSDGRPILGDLIEAESGQIRDRADASESSPSSGVRGFGRFRGLTVTAQGSIQFAFDNLQANRQHLPLIVPEDIEVALALAFGSTTAIWPRFSFEPPAPRNALSPDWRPNIACWTPEWLGHTALGETLFATDCEAGHYIPNKVECLPVKDDGSQSDAIGRLNTVINKMSKSTVRNYGHGQFITFTIAAVETTWSGLGSSSAKCTVHNAYVKLRTGAFDENDNRFYGDNTDTAIGYRAAIFNDHFDLFAEHYPLLERYRQLGALVTTLNQLSSYGFNPEPKLRAAAERTLRKYAMRPPPEAAKRLYYRGVDGL